MADTFSVDFSEMYRHPRSKWVRGEFRAIRRLICAWADRITLLAELNTEPGCLYPYPDGPVDGSGMPVATAYEASVDPFEAKISNDAALEASTGQAIASYESAVVTVRYSNRGPKYRNGLWVTEKTVPYTNANMALRIASRRGLVQHLRYRGWVPSPDRG